MNTLFRTIIPAASAALLAIAAESCRHTSESSVIDFTTRADSAAWLLPDYYGDSAYVAARYSVVWPERIGSRDFDALKDSLTALTFGEYTSADFDRASERFLRRTLATLTADTLERQPASFAEAQEAAVASMTAVESEVSLLTPDLLVISVHSWGYMPYDAHGTQSRRFINYSIRDHSLLTADKVFTSGSNDAIGKLIEQAARGKYTEAALFADACFTIGDFRFTDSGIEFVYQPYEVGPYSSGIITVELPAEGLAPYLTPAALSLFGE
ncbi:MAG: RsiV family protein [Muribaculaceae bacterium]|nr:RsiV family protein [Muribaculaceae bacterium]